MKLPLGINPCPIREAVVELRFESELPPDAVFGVVYNELKDAYKELLPLPITQIPEFVRVNDPNLVFQPHYRTKKDNFLLQIGPKMVSLSMTEEYSNWNEFLGEILAVFERIAKLGLISSVSRLGLRYINTFTSDILEQINLNITLYGESIRNKETFIRTAFEADRFQTILQIGNNAVFTTKENEQIVGSLIDIDVSTTHGLGDFFGKMEPVLQEAHQIEKERFFGLLKPDFLETLNPVY